MNFYDQTQASILIATQGQIRILLAFLIMIIRASLVIIENERELNKTLVISANLSVLGTIIFFLFDHARQTYDNFIISVFFVTFVA